MVENEFVAPAYGSRSLSDVLPAVGSALGFGSPTSQLRLPDAPAYVIFLIDGLGDRLLDRYRHSAPFLASLRAEKMTAGVPSTTATSLTSLGTGLTPGQHGLVGYTVRVPGTGRLLNHLKWDQDLAPEAWQPHPTIYADLAAAGLRVTTVNKREFERSGLTVASSRGAEFRGANTVAERVAATVAAAGRDPSLTYVYDSALDATGHKYGVASPEWLQMLSTVDEEAEQLREALPASVRLLVVADHGMIDSGPGDRVDIDESPGLREGITLLGGEARLRHLYCQGGAVDDVVAAWREVLGERALVLTREDAAGRGWFGAVGSAVAPRLGDVVVACRGNTALLSTRDFPYEAKLIGLHGSLTPAEMEIPLLLA